MNEPAGPQHDEPGVPFDALPRRVFLDSCTLQTLRDYGGLVYENESIDPGDRLHAVPQGHESVQALRWIFFVGQRAPFEWVVSEAGLGEAAAKKDAGHLQWAFDVLDHTVACLESSGGVTEESAALARRLSEPRFGYLSANDRALIRDAVLLRCDAFLTMEHRLPRNTSHIRRELGIQILRPPEFWAMLRPWARLFV